MRAELVAFVIVEEEQRLHEALSVDRSSLD